MAERGCQQSAYTRVSVPEPGEVGRQPGKTRRNHSACQERHEARPGGSQNADGGTAGPRRGRQEEREGAENGVGGPAFETTRRVREGARPLHRGAGENRENRKRSAV